VATFHDVSKEMISAHLTLVHIFHAYASVHTPFVAHELSHCTPVRYGRIASISMTHDATQFRDSICPVCVSTFQMLLHSDPTDTGLNRHRRALPPWSSEFQIRPLPFLPIQYSPFSPNCPARSPIMPFYQLLKFLNIPISNQGIKVLNLMSGTCHSTSTKVLSTKHSTTNEFSIMIGSRSYIKSL
jgi:hypothetical protein